MERYEFGSEQRFNETEWLPRNFGDDLPRPRPTSEEEEKMKREVIALGTIFRECRRRWQIDGSLNISLRIGEWIGFHRDVDISLYQRDIPDLEGYLSWRGYGFFLYRKETVDGCFFRIFKRIGAADFRRSEKWQLRIVAIDTYGKIRLNADLVFIDVALINEREESQFFGWFNVLFPDHWLAYKKEMVFANEVIIHLSHPARFLLSKIFFFRKSDEDDLEVFMGLGIITSKDLDDIEEILKGAWGKYKDRILLEMKDKIAARIERFRASLR